MLSFALFLFIPVNSAAKANVVMRMIIIVVALAPWCVRNLPQLERGPLTDLLGKYPLITHWFAQNPVYAEDSRYSGLLYGLDYRHLALYEQLGYERTGRDANARKLVGDALFGPSRG